MQHKNSTYRPYQEKDYNRFVSMVQQLYVEDSEGKSMTKIKIDQTIHALTENPLRGRIVIFEIESLVVGYAILINYWSNELGGNILHIDEIFVDAAYRGLGIGSNFFKELMKSPDIVALELEVTPSNERAMQMYKRLGFVAAKNRHLVLELSVH